VKQEKANIFFETQLLREKMTDIPPFPNSVHAQPPNQKHQIQKVEVERMQARETNRKSEVVTTFYDAKTYVFKNGQLSEATPKVSGQRILVTV
jgi:hypothetical protein